MNRIVIALASSLALFAVAEAADWPAFRGPNGSGISTETSFPTVWDQQKNVQWKVPLPEPGNGSPIVAQGRVFLTGASQDGRLRKLYCFDRDDGTLLWLRTVSFAKVETTHKTNPYGASTPVTDGEHIVVWHGSAGLYCYDRDGHQLWSNDPGNVEHIWGYGSSPVLHDGTVFLNHGPGVESFMLAVDLASGRTKWKTNEPGGTNDRKGRMVGSWSTPVVVSVAGEDQLVCSMPTRIVAYALDTGRILWTCGGVPSKRGDLVYTSPLVSGSFGVVLAGFQGPALGFRLGGRGDVTATHRLWRVEEKQPQRIGSGVVVDGHVYIGNAGPGSIQCIELKTGRVAWQARAAASNHWGSTICAGNHLYVTNQAGATLVFAPNRDHFKLIASNPLLETCNATPAFSDGAILIRTFEHLYCIAEQER